ncbi:MAG: hypothetical protein L0211_05455 [Planctomycetaceae bacterium]|nr:hypothetical protein [Planctomycetaceae bacterium]
MTISERISAIRQPEQDAPTCCLCGAQAKAPKAHPDKPFRRLKDGSLAAPMGWKKTADNMRCRDCTRANYITRSVRVRLIGAESGNADEWAVIRKSLNANSALVAKFANWYLQRLLAADLAMQPFEGKLPACPEVDYYADARRLFPTINPQGLGQAARTVRAYYADRRFAVLVAKNRNVDTYRWDGLPIPVHVQSWSLVAEEDRGIILRIGGEAGGSWRVKIYADGINLTRVHQLMSGEAEAGAASFIRRARPPREGEAKGQRRKRSWYLRIAGRFPKPTAKRKRLATKVLTLGHDKECLLYGVTDHDGDEPVEIHAADLRSMICGHRRRDRKRQVDCSTIYRAMPRRKAKRWAAARTVLAAKHQAKVTQVLKEVASHVAWKCERLGVDEVNYDPTDRGWIDGFPFHRLKSALANALEGRGIAFHSTGDDSSPAEAEGDE